MAPGSWQAVPGYSSITGQNQPVIYLDPAHERIFFRALAWLE
jgi:hypothetical protein